MALVQADILQWKNIRERREHFQPWFGSDLQARGRTDPAGTANYIAMEMDGPLGEWLNDNTYRWEGGLSLSVPSNWHVNDFEIHSGLYSEHPYKDIQRSCQTSIEGKYMGAPWILKPTGALFYEVISLHLSKELLPTRNSIWQKQNVEYQSKGSRAAPNRWEDIAYIIDLFNAIK